jgi:hypothetical protein
MAGSQKLRYANLWNDKMWTKDPEEDLLISEEILYAHSMDKETLLEKSSLSTLGKFNGTMNLQMIKRAASTSTWNRPLQAATRWTPPSVSLLRPSISILM